MAVLAYLGTNVRVRRGDEAVLRTGEHVVVVDIIPPNGGMTNGRVYVRGDKRGHRAMDGSEIGASWVSDNQVTEEVA
jgi:hypothetical protein